MLGNSVPEFYENLVSKKDMTVESRRYPAGYCGLPPRAGNLPKLDGFDFAFFGYSRKQAENLDVGVRTLLEVEEKFPQEKFRVLSEMRFLGKIRVAILDLVGYVEILAKFGAKSDFRV